MPVNLPKELFDQIVDSSQNIIVSHLTDKEVWVTNLYKNSRVWWQCEKGHEWQTTVKLRLSGRGCHVCSNRKIVAGVNDFKTIFPEQAKEWHPTKNGILKVDSFAPRSPYKAWWQCKKCEHEWEASLANRKNHSCPSCANNILIVGKNDLLTVAPDLAKTWHPTKNGTLLPSAISSRNKKPVWWQCEKGHEWQTAPHNRRISSSCPICSDKKVLRGHNDLSITHPNIASQWHPTKNKHIDITTVKYGSDIKAWWLCENGHKWKTFVYKRTAGQGCPKCSRIVSQAEKDIAHFLNHLNIKYEISNRTIIKGELDIYIPEKKIAVEFNGIYWHDENHKHKNYHYDKWKACKEKNIQLIQIWEDDWNRNPELIKRMLAYKLGITQERKVFARKTAVKQLTQTEANTFLEEHHIQGSVDGAIRIGLFEKRALLKNETLVSVMVLKREPGTKGKTFNLLRYATSVSVVGGFTKLLKHVEREFEPDNIITFSDNTISNGGLYKNNGFKPVKELKSDYKYVVKHVREHKFRYRLKRFKEDPSLNYLEGLTEKELALLNKIPRIWDAGKTRYEKSFKCDNMNL